ncbi:hypothetical protein QAD02_023729 [Eretmocerus hayati]|uniref:Uncharacterized protein n=1 Tax=Eretmocerus hayati TaxID=131215 RepID=A0ACC2PZ38_9HYME|nr:hypothetical protein QAD02_023729 [Eretmocerus hayati]
MGQGESSISVHPLSSDQQSLNDVEDEDGPSVQLTINNVLYKVPRNLPAQTSLNTFIRNVANLKGTKAMCLEGGCGACIVAAEINGSLLAVNSCLVAVILCDGWKITTVEGIGNRKMGYHVLQATLANMSGSQCGFCSPGWVMNMYSVSHDKQLTMKEIENSFANNLCRCTGYRPILETFKSFAKDAPLKAGKKIRDIEETYDIKSCEDCTRKMCIGTCKSMEVIHKSSVARPLELHLKSSQNFYKVMKVQDIFDLFSRYSQDTYQINGGNTGHGVYRASPKKLYIDVNDVADLHRVEKEKDSLTFGGNVTLANAMLTFKKFTNERGFAYLKEMYEHVDLVATIPVRNVGTIAGNLMLKNQHHEFPSDIFLILETAGAQIHILESPNSKKEMTLIDFLKMNMLTKIIYSVALPALSEDYIYKTFKIMPRAQNAHALVNAGFLFKLEKDGKIVEEPNIIFGGIRPDFLHALKTEKFLTGKNIYDPKHLQEAFKILQSEVNPDHVLPDYSPAFRKLLSMCLFYKFLLGVNLEKVKPEYRSGASIIQRGVSSAKQEFDTNRTLWPDNQPIPKIESIYQTSGEGEYINDVVTPHNEVHCAFTLAEAMGKIDKIDYDEALKVPGVIAFYSSKDVPGRNLFINGILLYTDAGILEDEMLFADKEVYYAGQPYGIIVAETFDIAQQAASKVKLIYTKGEKPKPLLTATEVITYNDILRMPLLLDWPAEKSPGSNTKYRIKGKQECAVQYHFTMETQSCVCVPAEDGMDVYSSTQYINIVQSSIAYMLNVPQNSINMKVRRIGGGYGCKLTRAPLVACACALACHKLNRPASMVLTIEDNMRAVGKRTPAYCEYELEVDKSGKIQKMDASMYFSVGVSFNEPPAPLAAKGFRNCYEYGAWSIKGYACKTDLPSNSFARAPGHAEGIAFVETIMERIARVTGKDPLEVRMLNLNEKDKKVIGPMIEQIKKSSDYEKRANDVAKFNQENRWKKRGISLVPMLFAYTVAGRYHSLVSIFPQDGTVAITHGGIEMGQGIHTKAAQVAAYTLGIDISLISVKPSMSVTAPNSSLTGASMGSDTVGYATKMACLELVKRLKKVKDKMGGSPPWKALVFQANQMNVDLCATFMFQPDQEDIKPYDIYGVTVAEVEIDVLTGQHLIRRVDIVEDTGVSLNPSIDIGQIEGAFVMGIGMWTSEDLIYDPETGVLTNNRTWNYKVPGAKDIPMDFRVTLNQNMPNPLGILRSKAVAEPPLCMACSIPIAIRHALNSARADAGNKDLWYQLDNALTNEKILLNSLTDIDGFKF